MGRPQRFSASVAGRHMACHASANLEAAIPNFTLPVIQTTAAADAGTVRHEVLEEIMKMGKQDIEGFARILRYISNLRQQRRFKVLVEHEFTAEWLQTKPTTKPDLTLYTQDQLDIVDYKWGKIPVKVVGNEQLLFYAATAAHLAPKAKGVRVHVLQPYADIYDDWFIDTNVLSQFIADAQRTELEIQQGDTSFGPSDHCTFCPANPHGRGIKGKPLCPTMMGLLYPDKTDEDAILSL